MQKFVSDFLFGLAFGCGLCVAYAVLQFIVSLLSHARPPVLP